MYNLQKPLILASSSPRRKTFLDDLGLGYTVEVMPIDETVLPGEDAKTFVHRMAREKGRHISEKNPKSWVLAADTVVCLAGTILGKPTDPDDAVRMLMTLSGNSHIVMTGFSLMCHGNQVEESHVVTTKVTFTAFGENDARAYVATGDPLDKAGSYGIQDRGGVFVEKIDGSYSNVVGLPLAELVSRLEFHDIIRPHLLGG